jgi:hypothetical protein
MTPEEAVELQKGVVKADPNLFVNACPGSGKTRAVVDRYVRIASDPSSAGVAAISFTNRASDEVGRRCAEIGMPDAAGFPNFVGTFDRFVATYVVRPFGRLNGPIRILDSWASIDAEVSGPGGRPVSLDHFEVSPDGVLRFDPADSDPNLSATHARIRAQNAAREISRLRNEGYLTCDDAREYALRLIRDHPEIITLLCTRFDELIIDEAQDCSETEVAFLQTLHSKGMPIVVVCDPHQAIYEWRDANPERLAEFTQELEPHFLTGNWRSSGAICSLAASLKDGHPDHPVGPHRTSVEPIHLLPYDGWPSQLIGDRFVDLLKSNGIAEQDSVVLAHAGHIAARVAGAGRRQGSNNVARILGEADVLFDPSALDHERRRSLERLQRTTLRFLRIPTSSQSTERACEANRVDPLWLRNAAVGLAQAALATDPECTITDWIDHMHNHLGSLRSPAGHVGKPRVFLKAPKGSGSDPIAELLRPKDGSRLLRSSSVHQAKGSEAKAVLVTLPRDRKPSTRTADLLSAWEFGHDTEARRVLYVAVTRAERLCALAVPQAHLATTERILTTTSVPFSSR